MHAGRPASVVGVVEARHVAALRILVVVVDMMARDRGENERGLSYETKKQRRCEAINFRVQRSGCDTACRSATHLHSPSCGHQIFVRP